MTAHVPERNGVIVGRVDPGAGRVGAADLVLVVVDEPAGLVASLLHRTVLTKRAHVVAFA